MSKPSRTTPLPPSSPKKEGRIIVLTKYDERMASTRYRFSQYFPLLTELGYECHVAPLFGKDYLDARLYAGRRPITSVVKAYGRRVGQLLAARDFDLVVVSCEIFPYLPTLFDSLFLRRLKFVLDIDDAFFQKYEEHPSRLVRGLLAKKFPTMIARATQVWAGGQVLADYCTRYNANVVTVPTVVRAADFPDPRPRHADERFTIGWIGSPTTSPYVREVESVLRRFCASHECATVCLVGAGDFTMDGVPLENRPWAQEREVADLLSFDVGIMPLTDDLWSRGKCGFKIIQYMAAGVPSIASPVGANCDIVLPGITGFLPSSDEEWLQALDQMYADTDLRLRMGAAGRERMKQMYSAEVIGPRILDLVQRL